MTLPRPKKSPAERIKYLMRLLGFKSDYAMARALEIPRSTIRSIIDKDQIGLKTARILAEKLNLELAWVESGFGPMRRREPKGAKHPVRVEAHGPSRRRLDERTSSFTNSISQRIRYLQDAFRLPSDSAFAEASGVKEEELKRILDADDIDEATAKKIAARLSVPHQWIKEGRGRIVLNGLEAMECQGLISETSVAGIVTLADVPLSEVPPEIVWVPKASPKLTTDGELISEEIFPPERFAFRREWLEQISTTPNNLILMDIDGDSMATTLQNGDAVLIDLGRVNVVGGGIYATAVGHVVQIKRLEPLPGDRLRLISDNHAYDDYTANPGEIRIIGLVIWIGRALV